MTRFRPPQAPIRRLLAAVLVAAAALLAACAPSPEEEALDREVIAETLREYGRLLSLAYTFTDPELLAPVAMPREIAQVGNNIALLAEEGRRIASDQKELVVEDVRRFQGSNAYVTTYEVWDLRVLAIGAEREVSRDENQQSRVRYHVKIGDDGNWKVVWRQRLEDAAAGGS